VQSIKLIKATQFPILCSESLLIVRPTFNPGQQFCRPLAYTGLKYVFGKVYYILIALQKLKGVLGGEMESFKAL